MTTEKLISRNTYLQILGLAAIMKLRYQECRVFEAELLRLIGMEDQGNITDLLYGEEAFDEAEIVKALRRDGYAIEEQADG